MTARRANRTDGNHALIAEAFKALGCDVLSLAAIGDGAPDLLVAMDRERSFLVEVKDPAQPPSKRRLTPKQKEFHRDWLGTVHLVETVEQVAAIVRSYRNRRGAA